VEEIGGEAEGERERCLRYRQRSIKGKDKVKRVRGDREEGGKRDRIKKTGGKRRRRGKGRET